MCLVTFTHYKYIKNIWSVYFYFNSSDKFYYLIVSLFFLEFHLGACMEKSNNKSLARFSRENVFNILCFVIIIVSIDLKYDFELFFF